MSEKQAIEINCSGCNTSFRLWVPEELVTEWEKGAKISCVRCSARFRVKKGDEGFEVSPLEEEGETGGGGDKPAAGGNGGGIPVLFVEEDKLARAIAESSLENIGVNLLMAKNAEEALESLKSKEVELIVTDLHLKDPDNPDAKLGGEAFLKKAIEGGTNIPAIVTTGQDLIDDIVLDNKWFGLNVKGFVQKGNPFWAEELKDKIKEALGLN